jgi:phage terminase large subunit-like protein
VKISTAGVRFHLFQADYMRHTKGRWAGQPVILEPWQIEIASEMLRTEPTGWYDGDPYDWESMRAFLKTSPTGRRVYQEGYVQVAKKNGKSTMASGFSAYFLIADGEMGAEVYNVATTGAQARIVFDQAKKSILASPLLRDFVRVYKDTIYVPDTDSILRVLSADAPGHEGLNPSAVVLDELHRHENRDMYDTMTSGSGARAQPFFLDITNAGVDPDSVCFDVYSQGKAVEQGHPEARSDLYFYAPAPEYDEMEDRSKWKISNPASWITMEQLEQNYRRFPRSVFARRYLNMWVRSDDIWLPVGAWEDCEGEAELVEDLPVFLGVDLGLKHDTAAVGWAQPLDPDDPETSFRVGCHVWGLHNDPEKAPPAAHEILINESRLSISLVEDWIEDFARRHYVEEIAYDPWRFERSAQRLDDMALSTMVEFLQIDSYMVPATDLMYRLITDGKTIHGGDHVLSKHVEAAAFADTMRGARLTKRKAKQPMDGLIAVLMATVRAQHSAIEGSGRPSITAA